MGLAAMIFVFWMLSFKPTFSLSTFTFIKKLFSSSSVSAIRVLSSAYLRLLIFLQAILIPACVSSSPAFQYLYISWKSAFAQGPCQASLPTCLELPGFPWEPEKNSPGKNTEMDCHSLLQGIFPTQGSSPGLPYCRQILSHQSHQGSTWSSHQRLIASPPVWVVLVQKSSWVFWTLPLLQD